MTSTQAGRELRVEMFVPENFWQRVARKSSDECWLWLGSMDGKGYGQFSAKGRRWLAHRVAYALTNGITPADTVLDHLCRTRLCCNPAHLEATSVAVNTARGHGITSKAVAARLNGMCINGHVIAEVGLHKAGRNGMTCAECGRERVRRYKQRKDLAA